MKLVGWALTSCMRLALGASVAAFLSISAYAQDGEFYRLVPGDVVEVTVLEDPDLGRQLLVRPDGRVTMPLAGTVMAEGRSPEQVQGTIRARLAKNFVEPPTVTVAVVSVREDALALEEQEEIVLNGVYILGEVARPGKFEYPNDEPMTVLQALTLAGGVGPFAAIRRIQVREVVDGIETVRLFNYEAIEDGASVSAADYEPLTDGAILIVPERGFLE